MEIMKKLPYINKNELNKILAPYFKTVTEEILTLHGMQRKNRISEYKRYIESEARKAQSSNVRLQLRIYLSTLLNKFSTIPNPTVTVRPKKLIRIFLGAGHIELAVSDLGPGMHIIPNRPV